MISSVIPEISFDFNFDFVLLIILLFYIIYGYFSGGHKQIRLSINLILPFVIIYYMGKTITNYLYIPLSNTFLYEMINEYMSVGKNIIGMIFAYLFTYVGLFVGIFILSIYAKKYVLNENMKAKLGKKNNYLGAIFAFINGYVLVYFIILPAFSLNLVGTEAHVTNFVLEHPPPFSRIARTAEKAVPIKGLADKANDFQELLSVEGIEGYYNDAIYEYQKTYIGNSDSFESQFMKLVYPELTESAKLIVKTEYNDYFAKPLTSTDYYGISVVLLQPGVTEESIYKDVLAEEEAFAQTFKESEQTAGDYLESINQYDIDKINFDYQLLLDDYLADLDEYLTNLNLFTSRKLTALANGEDFTETFTGSRPIFRETEPTNYEYIDTSIILVNPEDNASQSILDAVAYVELYENKEDVTSKLNELGKNFEDHKGLLEWYINELDKTVNLSSESADISSVIVSFKANYQDISSNINDDDLQDKLYLAMMSITSYDVFTSWLECTQEVMANVALDDVYLSANRCPAFTSVDNDDYNFGGEAFNVVKTLFEGESVSWIITQFKYDYESGIFDAPFSDYPEVASVLLSTKDLVDDYDEYYKDIANSIEGNISMIIKIGISVMKYHLDVYETLENTPLLSATFNDAARFCPNLESVQGYDVEVCTKSSGETGSFKELFNMRYLISEIYFKAYFMVDENNDKILYDTLKMHDYLDSVNIAVENNVITKDVITAMGDQLAFNIIDETNGTTLLEEMFNEGYITIEAMRVLADDEYELFSDEFSQRVKSYIR